MCKLWIDVCVVITLVQTQFISGDLTIDQKIREGRQRELGVRLVGGNSSSEGRIEIWYNNTWGTVCDDRFGIREAEVVCHMLGYERLGAMPYVEAAYGQGNGPIWVDELQCQGNEISVRDCLHSPWGLHDCWHREDAGVKCRKKKNDDRNRMITFELDLVVEETEKHKIFDRYKSYRKNAVKDPSKRWNESTIYYVFGDGIDNSKTDLIRDALDEWSDYSCIDFSKSVSNDNYNQIVFISKQGDERCGSTYVGMKPSSQEIYLGKDCFKRDIILHEVGHALGFYHEHNRADRDSFIKIHYENIEQGKEDSFKKLKQNVYEDYDKPYDYKSIMHYGQYFFSKNERITIETLKPEYQDIIGKARHPSFLDYKILNTMYECSARCDDIKCPDGGFLGKNCYCYCEEDEDDKSIRPCFKKKKCPNLSINSYLFDVLDKRNEIWVNVSYINHYPDKTVLNLFSTNKKCTLASQLQCDNGTWKGNIQDCPVQLELQFVDGSGNEGIVEVKLNGEYGFIGYICDDDWDDNDATVACRMMGFEFGKARFELSYKINESLPILLDDVKCSGNESTLSECKHNDWGKHDCTYTEVAAIECVNYTHTKHIDVLSNYDCGKIPRTDLKRKKRQSRIVKGSKTKKGMIPWQVRIERKELRRWGHSCGGTLISSHWILSAAHCFKDLKKQKVNYEDFRVYVGDHSRTKPDVYEQRFDIEYLVKHRQYSETDGEVHTHPNDIALLKIKSMSGDGAVFNDYVQPACLPGENDPLNYGMQCEVSGWGILREGGQVMPDYLMSGKVAIVNERKCEEMYNDIKSEMDLQRMFCAGDGKIGTDTCQGDSGGPLVCDMNDRNTVIGITSWGRGCGRPDAPGVYTNVAAYVSWIKEQISLYDSAEGCILPKNSAKFRYPKTAYNVGETLTEFDCDPGFIVSSPSIMTCQKGGSWSDNVVCQRGCSLPNHAANHKRWGTTFGPGETVNNFFCDHGYVLSSEKGMTCRHDGSWSHTVTCIKGCTLPNHAANSKDWRTTFSPGETLNNFHCNQGYVLSSQNGMTCRHDGSWSEIVKCVKVCKLPNNAANYKRWRTTFTPGETLNDFYCNQGYVLSSLHGMTCRHDGSWSKIVTCIKGLDQQQQTCIDSFDSGHNWRPRWDAIRTKDRYDISRGRRLSLRGCKQACINLKVMQCIAVVYYNDHKICWGFAVSDTSYFSWHLRGSSVYLRTCKQSD